MDFTGMMAALDAAVNDHLCDDGFYLADNDIPRPVRLMIDHPRSVDRLQGMSFTRARPVMRCLRASCPGLVEGHLFRLGGDLWSVAEAPIADDQGAWWAFEVQPR